MSWAVIAVGGVTLGVGLWQGAEANKKAKKNNAFGKVPEHALYSPVNIDKSLMASVAGNQAALPDIQNLIFDTNTGITSEALRRAKKLIPGYKQAMKTYGAAGVDLLGGRLPFEDVLGIVGDRTALSNTLGTPGTAGPATLKDLGIKRLDAIQAGGGILKDMVNIAGAISPTGNYALPQNFMLSPTERLRADIEQRQLQQQNQQSGFNLAGSADPGAAAALQLALSQAGQLQGAGTSLIGAGLGRGFGGAGGTKGWSGNTSYPATAYGNPSYFSSRPAYYNGTVVPRATAV